MVFQTPPQKMAKHPGGDRTGVWENRTKFNQEQARIINDGIYWMEKKKWTEVEEPQEVTFDPTSEPKVHIFYETDKMRQKRDASTF